MAKICGAKTRSGLPCQKSPMANGRCKLHGGKSTGAPKGNKNHVVAGSLYSKYYTEEEQQLADEISLDSIDEEIRLCKIRLSRLLALEAKQEAEELELERIVETPPIVGGIPIDDDDTPPVQQKTFVRKDYDSIIQRTIARIESLTLTRQKITNGAKVDLTNSDGSLKPTVIELVVPDDDNDSD
ncbi:HGGxSTG domain-containing protein [Kingella negevensis]|uniref:HGGxSTG domain-containing protein n=1 Tax=Kingella negevensis TaxID=1522312 RepID=UPI0025511952|nr:HGGxSTG domain-containing protein [Kingella negevensis]MDK4689684.1 HGGxSTG domain-containing protein [Kingella negevensis]